MQDQSKPMPRRNRVYKSLHKPLIQVQRTAVGRRVTEIAHVQGFSREAKCFALETVFPALHESSLTTH